MGGNPVFKLIRGVLPVLYCAGLLYYFFDVAGGSVQQAEDMGLGPTLLGLTVVGLLFCIPLIVKLVFLFAGPHLPKPGGRSDSGGPSDDGGSRSKVDAAIARYLAQQPAQGPDDSPAPSSARGGGPAKPAGFGRRIR